MGTTWATNGWAANAWGLNTWADAVEASDAAVFVVCVTGGDRRVITVTGYTGGPGCR